MFSTKVAVCLAAAALATAARAEEPAAAEAAATEQARKGDAERFGEEISVTATRAARRTRDVPQAIAVVGKEQLEDKVVFNMKDVVAGTPGVLIDTKNGGYDARLLIRGAGLKASYGVREIMVLRDGVPLTDPDSFTRLDFVDMQDVERIEIAKGPGNLFSPGSAGGAIQILSRSVFDPSADTARLSVGAFGSGTAHLRTSTSLAGNALALTASYRQQENGWRTWNDFRTAQVSLKHGVALGDGATLESEAAFTKADTQLPGAMNGALYATFKATGEQETTSEPWKNSGRYSKIFFLNSKLEQRVGEDLVLKPRVYYTQWRHLHPVTGSINDMRDWTRTVGGDLEAQHEHALRGVGGTLVAGVTVKGQWNDDVRKYRYRDVQYAGGVSTGRVLATLSDAEGDLMQTQAQRNLLYGAFVQETLRPHDRVTIDLGLRYDRSSFRIRENDLWAYDWGTGAYVEVPPEASVTLTRKTFELPAPKAGVSVRVTSSLSAYASAARASQIPSENEIVSNPLIDASVTTSYETGLKLRSRRTTVDVAAYWMGVRDDIVQSVQDGETRYVNAGRTRKRGVEVAGAVRLPHGLEMGATYAYSDYVYLSFQEPVRGGDVDRSGKRLPYVPRHQYGAFAAWKHGSGLRLRVQSNTWGRYWMDSANTASYPGYAFLTSVAAAYAFGRHELVLDVENAFDQRYAMQATRDATGTRDLFSAGTPRFVSLGYRFGL